MKILKLIIALFPLSFTLKSFSSQEFPPHILEQLNIGKQGDIICYNGAFRSLLKLKTTPFTHSAIDLGNGNIIEFSGGSNSRGAAKIRMISKLEFISRAPKGKSIFTKKTQSKNPEEVIERAEYFLEHPEEIGPYDPIYNNCQHFAMLCSTGKKTSWQADPARQIAGTLVKVFLGKEQGQDLSNSFEKAYKAAISFF